MIKKFLILITLVLLTSSCSIYHVTSESTTDTLYPVQTVSDVEYLETIDQPHEIIATITVNAERRQSISNIMEKMKREAAILGGNAITNIQTDATGVWKRLPAQQMLGNAYVRANFTVSVVVLEETQNSQMTTD